MKLPPNHATADLVKKLQEGRDLGKHLSQRIQQITLDTLTITPPEMRPALLLYAVNQTIAQAVAGFVADAQLPNEREIQETIAAGVLDLAGRKFCNDEEGYKLVMDSLLKYIMQAALKFGRVGR